MTTEDPSNPFEHTDTFESNPFDAEDPFSDPSVAAAASNDVVATVEAVDITTNAADETTLADEVSPSVTTAPTGSLDDLERIANARGDMELQLIVESLRLKERDIEARQKEMNDRELELAEREKKGIGYRPANWPKFKPIVRQDIANDIPEKFRLTIKLGWINVWITLFALFMNMLGMLAYFAGGGPSLSPGAASSAGNDFGISLVWLILGFPVAFFIYRLHYNSMRKVRASSLILFYILFGFEIAIDIYMLVGFALSGSCGFIHTIGAFNGGNASIGVLCLIPVIIFFLLAFYNGFILRTVILFYKDKDVWEDAKREAAGAIVQRAAENPDAVAKIAANAV